MFATEREYATDVHSCETCAYGPSQRLLEYEEDGAMATSISFRTTVPGPQILNNELGSAGDWLLDL